MGESFVSKGSVFDNMALSPAIKGSLDNSLMHTNNGAVQDIMNKSKLNDTKVYSVKPHSNTNLQAHINSPKQPIIQEEPSADQLMLQDVL
jgi:hypothetical protein